MKLRNVLVNFRNTVARVSDKAFAAGGLVLASAVPLVASADTTPIEDAITAAITRATNVATLVVGGYFAVWAVFTLLKAKKG